MPVETVAIAGLVVFLWGLSSARLQHADLTAPLVLVGVGGALAAVGLVDAGSAPDALLPLVEVALVWVLFSDASAVPLGRVRRDLGRYLRLLGVGLPLTVAAGWLLAYGLVPGLGAWTALLVGAALAPTDSALGLPVVTNPAVPARIRQLISVESGLNDGIVTPVVLFALAGATAGQAAGNGSWLGEALLELGLGVLTGAGIGLGGGGLLRWARGRGWAGEESVGAAVLALTLVAYAGALAVSANGFVAAFCGGLGFGAAAGRQGPAERAFLDQAGGLVSLLVWLAFGALALPIAVARVDLVTVLYAVLSLTVVRMVPVAVACAGSGLDRDTVLFVGWFGPRGLASLVFALIALDELGDAADRAVAVIAVTVLLSVVAHGLTAAPLASRYRRALGRRGRDGHGGDPDAPGPA
ncbi:cation:proton antiporter [Geodermatophilus sp. SYSU D00814]